MRRLRFCFLPLVLGLAACNSAAPSPGNGGAGSAFATIPPDAAQPTSDSHGASLAPTWRIGSPRWAREVSTLVPFHVPGRAPYGFSNLATAGSRIFAIQSYGRVYAIGLDGAVRPVAGTDRDGYVDGPAGQARFRSLSGLAVTSEGRVYLSERLAHRLRELSPDLTSVQTLAGDGFPEQIDGTGTRTRFLEPTEMAVGPDGNLYLVEGSANDTRVRRITPQGEVSTIMRQVPIRSTPLRFVLEPGALVITGNSAKFVDLAFGSGGTLFVLDQVGRIFTYRDGRIAFYFDPTHVDGRLADHATNIGNPTLLEGLGDGSLLASDGRRIWRMTSDRQIELLAGPGDAQTSRNGTGESASFIGLSGMALQDDGSLLVTGPTEGVRRLRF